MRGRAGWLVVAAAVAACSERSRTIEADGVPLVAQRNESFGLVGLRRVVSSPLELRNGGVHPLRVREVRLEGPDAADYEVGPLAGQTVLPAGAVPLGLRFRPSAEGGRAATLVLVTDSRTLPELRVALEGVGVRAEARISARVLDFGRVEVSSRRALLVELANDSGLPLELSGAWSGDAGPFAAAIPARLAPGGRAHVPVSFGPREVGGAAATLRITPCENCDPVPVELRGEGLDSALVLDPGDRLDFGALDVDRREERLLTLRNQSDLPVALEALAFAAGTDLAYELAAPGLPAVLAPGASLAAAVALTPSHLGAALGRLELRTDSPRWPVRPIALQGLGGGPEAAVSPEALDFGDHAIGSKSARPIRLQNNGGSVVELVISSARLDGAAAFTAAIATPLTLAAGAHLDVPVLFAPTAPGPVAATLTLETNDGATPTLQVALSGSGHPVLPCELKVTPSRLDFGALPPGQGAVLGVRAENTGRDRCAVTDLAIEGDSSGRFQLSGRVPPGFELSPGEWFVRHVDFLGGPAGDYGGTVAFTVSDPAAPRREVPIQARVEAGCVQLVPPFLDWGLVRGDCGVPARSFEALNTCPAPVQLTSLALGEGTADDFELLAAPAPPLELAPGARARVEVGYRAAVLGETLQPLYLGTSDGSRPRMLPLLGENWFSGQGREVFIQSAAGQLDVLLVVDNSESMLEEQARFAAAVPALVGALGEAGVDARFAVTTTGLFPAGVGCLGGAAGGEAGRFSPVNRSAPRVWSGTGAAVAEGLARGAQVGFCHYLEQPLEAARRALSPPLVDSADDPRTPEPGDGNAGFLRDSAALALVTVSDEDDHSSEDVGAYAAFLRNLKGAAQPERLRVVAIAPTARACASAASPAGPRAAALAALTGGEVWDVCEPDYAPPLRRLAQQGVAPQAAFRLSGNPDPGSVAVAIDGVPQASGWSYDPAAREVRFDAGAVPSPGARVVVTYQKTCAQ